MQGARNAKYMLEAGNSVVVCFRNSGDLGKNLHERLEHPGARFHCFTAGKFETQFVPSWLDAMQEPYLFLRGFAHGAWVIPREKPDVVHVNNGGFPGAAGARGFALAALCFGSQNLRIIFTVNNQAVPYKTPMRIIQWPVDRLLSKSRINWVTGSANAAKRLLDVLDVDKAKVHPIRNGPEVRCSCRVTSKGPISRSRKDIVALQVGHLEHRKGQEVLIQAIALLHSRSLLQRNWQVVIEGEGPLRSYLENLVASYGLENYVNLIGKSDCIFHLYQASDFLVHPSTFNDDLPNVVSEAMSLGLPVIASNHAGLPEQVEDGANGFLVTPGDPEMLATALWKVMGNPALRVEMSKRSRARYEERFAPDLAIRAFESLYLGKEERRD